MHLAALTQRFRGSAALDTVTKALLPRKRDLLACGQHTGPGDQSCSPECMESRSGRYRRAMTSYAAGTCRICREVKNGRIPDLPTGVAPVAEPIPGGVVLRPGEGPAPFVCADCEQRQRGGRVALLPGQVIEVEDDGHWRPGVFVRAGEPWRRRQSRTPEPKGASPAVTLSSCECPAATAIRQCPTSASDCRVSRRRTTSPRRDPRAP